MAAEQVCRAPPAQPLAIAFTHTRRQNRAWHVLTPELQQAVVKAKAKADRKALARKSTLARKNQMRSIAADEAVKAVKAAVDTAAQEAAIAAAEADIVILELDQRTQVRPRGSPLHQQLHLPLQ